MSERILLTKEKYEQLKNEITRLREGRKKELSETLEQARLNDVSEDTDEISAVMSELEGIEKRISEMKEVLTNATIIKRNKISKTQIGVGNIVKLELKGKKLEFQIVSEFESDPSEGKISNRSPLGSALIGHKKNDLVNVKINGREVEYKVLSIS